MHQAQGGNAALVLQIQVIRSHLVGQQQTLVDHGAAGHAGNVIFLAVFQVQVLDGGAGGLADDIQLALEGVLHDHIVAAADENLPDDRFFLAHGGRHRHFAVDRYVAPAQQHLAFRLDGALELLLACQPRGMLLGQEDHAHSVFAGRRQLDALARHFLAVERVRHLDQDARPVAHELVGAHRAPVVEVFQDLQALLNDRMALFALDVRDETDSASVMFVASRIKALLLQIGNFGGRGHGALLHRNGTGRILHRNNNAKQNNWGQIPIIILISTDID